ALVTDFDQLREMFPVASIQVSNVEPADWEALGRARIYSITIDGKVTTVQPDFSVITRPISAVTGQGVSPIVVTSNGHGLRKGDHVQSDGVEGNTAANGSFVVTRLDANRFELTRTAGNGVYLPDSGVWYRINSISAVSNIAGPIKITSRSEEH